MTPATSMPSRKGNAGSAAEAGGGVGGLISDDSVVPCTSDKVCAESGRLCDADRSVCVDCRTDDDCESLQLCVSGECSGYTPCESSRECPIDQVCAEAVGFCVECVADADCSEGGSCVIGRCHAPCDSDKDCAALDQLCDEANGYCVDCIKDGDCGSNAYCESGLCHAGVCEPNDALCLGAELLTCDASGRGYGTRQCGDSCSETDGAHCTDEQGAGGAGGMNGGGGAGSAEPCGDTTSDPANCGACGYVCVHGRECTAGRCVPAWQPLAIENAPTARTRHAAGFVNGQFVVLGGATVNLGAGLSTTAGYDVESDTWSNLASLNSARCSHEAVSTGSVILTFGGLSDCGNGSTTGPGLERFTPNATVGAWSSVSAANTPAPRYNFAATWTGTSLFVYGGGSSAIPALATGGLFVPAGSAWSDASCALAGCERGGTFSAFTDGNVVRIWGGGPYGNAPAGLTYNLLQESWIPWAIPTGTADRLAQRFADDGQRLYFLKSTNLVSIYDRTAGGWSANDTSEMPADFCTEGAAAWTGSELVAWSGNCGAGPVHVGGRYQPPAPE